MSKKPKPKPEPVRYHFTDAKPFKVQCEEGIVELGIGWLAITEAEYTELRARPDITEKELKRLKAAKRELEDLRDEMQDAYLRKSYYDDDDTIRSTDTTRGRR